MIEFVLALELVFELQLVLELQLGLKDRQETVTRFQITLECAV
jgi:hypothetical protein